jgi:hypothetical protein
MDVVPSSRPLNARPLGRSHQALCQLNAALFAPICLIAHRFCAELEATPADLY